MNQPVTTDYLCQRLNVQDYFMGEAEPAMRLLLEKHLNECDDCAAKLLELRRLRALLKLAFGDESDFVKSKLGHRPGIAFKLKTRVDVAAN